MEVKNLVYSFNLVDRPWIPCLMLDDEYRELSIKETLAMARKIREIHASSPLVTAAVHRLLLAVLHRNFGPTNSEEWLALWRERKGMWDMTVLEEYFKKHRRRFDLFDEENPFYQINGEFDRSKQAPVTRLLYEQASGNNATLFDHTLDQLPTGLSAAEGARALVAHQAFAVGGGRSPTGYTSSGPLAGGIIMLLLGDNLFETLMLNLIRYNLEDDEPFPCMGEDIPAWEKDEPVKPGATRKPHGYLDLLTWQSRAVRLFPEGETEKPVIFRIFYGQGEGLDAEGLEDPQIPRVKRENETPRRVRLRPERVIWRDSTALLNISSKEIEPPKASAWTNMLIGRGFLDPSLHFRAAIFGLASDRAKVLLWREEQLPLPLRYLEQPEYVTALSDELSKAEDVGSRLWVAFNTLALYLLYPEADQREKEVKIDRDAVRKKTDEFTSAVTRYWSMLEYHFLKLLTGLVQDEEKAPQEWTEAVRKTAWSALEGITTGVEHSGRTLKAAVRARAVLGGGLNSILGRKEGQADAG